MSRCLRFVPALLASAIIGCQTSGDSYFTRTHTHANVYASKNSLAFNKVALMPFKAPTDLIGTSVSDMFVTEMQRTENYTIVERGQLAKVLGETEMALSGLSDKKAMDAAKLAGAEAVILGTVDEYILEADGGSKYASVGISIRMIDCNTGKAVWSASLAERSNDKSQPLAAYAREIVHQITSALYNEWLHQDCKKSSSNDSGRDRDNRSASRDRESDAAPVVIAPPARVLASDNGLREIGIKWQEPPDTVKQCRIERSTDPANGFLPIATVSASKCEYRDRGTSEAQLKDATSYYYRLVAVTKNGQESSYSEIKKGMTAPPPAPPQTLKAEAPAARAVALAWDPSPSDGVVKYLVSRAGEGDFEQIAEVKDCFFREGGTEESPLKDSTTYTYRITSVNRAGSTGLPSKILSVKTLPPPAVVTGIKAEEAQVRCVPLSWSPSPESDVVKYLIYRRDGTNTWSKIATVKGREKTSFCDGGREPGELLDDHAYTYTIRAVNAVTSESADSPPLTVTTRGAPPTPVKLAAESGKPRAIPLTWEASTDSKVAGYIIYRAVTDAGEYTQLTTIEGRDTTSWVDKDGVKQGPKLGKLGDATKYNYSICAYNIANVKSRLSGAVSATTKKVPAAPAGLEASAAEIKTVSLIWTANDEKDIAEYVVEASDREPAKFKEILRVKAGDSVMLKAKHEALKDGASLAYRVKAIDTDTLESIWSAEVKGSTKPKPDAPKKVAAELKGTDVTITWSEPPQTDVKKYNVYEKGFFRNTLMATVEKPQHTAGAEYAGKKFKVLVASVDTDGLESDLSEPVEIVPAQK